MILRDAECICGGEPVQIGLVVVARMFRGARERRVEQSEFANALRAAMFRECSHRAIDTLSRSSQIQLTHFASARSVSAISRATSRPASICSARVFVVSRHLNAAGQASTRSAIALSSLQLGENFLRQNHAQRIADLRDLERDHGNLRAAFV